MPMKTKTHSFWSARNALPGALVDLHRTASTEDVSASMRWPSLRGIVAPVYVLQSVLVADGLLQVIGDGEDGIYEWVWFRQDRPAIYTTAGFCSLATALYDGLSHVKGEASL